jgi:hypothetical protein
MKLESSVSNCTMGAVLEKNESVKWDATHPSRSHGRTWRADGGLIERKSGKRIFRSHNKAVYKCKVRRSRTANPTGEIVGFIRESHARKLPLLGSPNQSETFEGGNNWVCGAELPLGATTLIRREARTHRKIVEHNGIRAEYSSPSYVTRSLKIIY